MSKDDLEDLETHMRSNNADIVFREITPDSRYVSLYQICQTALKEKFPRVSGWDGED